MQTPNSFTSIPRELHRATMYDWGRRGIRSRDGFRFRGANGRSRCTFDPSWNNEFTRIPARAGNERLLRRISRMTTEWIPVAQRRGAFWSVGYYLVPAIAANLAKKELAAEAAAIREEVPF